MAGYSQRDIRSIKKAVDGSYKKLGHFRENRVELIRKYVGQKYEADTRGRSIPFNILAQAIQIFSRNLFAKNPSVMVSTAVADLRPVAKNLGRALGHLLKVIEYKTQMDMCIVNSLLGVGIMKTGLLHMGDVNVDGVDYAYGQPHAMAVDLDDWVHDTSARTWNEISFCGNRSVIRLDDARNNTMLDEEARASLVEINDLRVNKDGTEKVSKISRGDGVSADEDFEKLTEVWEVWIPRDGTIVSFGNDDSSNIPLKIVEWDGPAKGPYNMLKYLDVPNNIQPVPPAAHWEDLHDLINSLMRKLRNQAQREKEIIGVMRGGERDGNKAHQSMDGDVISMDNPKNLVQMRFGGPDSATLGFMLQCKDLVSWLAGNLDSLGGLSTQAPTLGQEELLAKSSSKQMADMQDRVVAFNKDIITDLAYHLWNDPIINIPLSIEMPGGRTFPDNFSPEMRQQGVFNDYNFDIEPYSMQEVNPQAQLAQLKEIIGTLMPVLPLMQQQGKTIDFGWVAQEFGRLTNYKGMDKLLVHADPSTAEPPEQAVVTPGKPANTTRTEIRRSVPGANRHGKDQIMTAALMGNKPQPSEMAALSRPV